MRDLAARHSRASIRDPLDPLIGTGSRYAIALGIVDSQSKLRNFGQQLNVDLHADGSGYRWSYNSGQLDDSFAHELKQHFDDFIYTLGRIMVSELV